MELTAEDENGEEVTHTILSLRVGGTEQVRTVTTGGRRGGVVGEGLQEV